MLSWKMISTFSYFPLAENELLGYLSEIPVTTFFTLLALSLQTQCCIVKVKWSITDI